MLSYVVFVTSKAFASKDRLARTHAQICAQWKAADILG